MTTAVTEPEKVDQHGDFQYTLRQFLLMRRNNQGGDWTEVLADVNAEQRHHPDWDMDATNTYMDWQDWYRERESGNGLHTTG